MTIIGLKELRQNATEIAERASKGEYFTVVKRSVPVFEISPPKSNNKNSELGSWLSDYMKKNEELLVSLKDK